MMPDTPIETLQEHLSTEESLEPTATETESDGAEPRVPRKKADVRPPNRRVRRAFARVITRMQDDVRNLGVHIKCGRPFVGPASNRCNCSTKAVLVTDSMTFQASHERGKHDI
jgi:hypothetical protein